MKATKEFKLTKAQKRKLEVRRTQGILREQQKNEMEVKMALQSYKRSALKLLDKGETFLAWACFERLGSIPAGARHILGIAIGVELIRTRKIKDDKQMREFIEGFE